MTLDIIDMENSNIEQFRALKTLKPYVVSAEYSSGKRLTNISARGDFHPSGCFSLNNFFYVRRHF